MYVPVVARKVPLLPISTETETQESPKLLEANQF